MSNRGVICATGPITIAGQIELRGWRCDGTLKAYEREDRTSANSDDTTPFWSILGSEHLILSFNMRSLKAISIIHIHRNSLVFHAKEVCIALADG